MAWKPEYVTVAELKTDLKIIDAVDDAALGRAISAASRAVDRATNRQFGQVAAPEVRVYVPEWDRRRRRWVVAIDDLMTEVGLTVTTEAGTVDVFTKEPVNAAVESEPWTRLVIQPESAVQPTGYMDDVTVVAQFGWAAVPVAVQQATLLQATRFFKRKDAPFGVAGSPELGSELRLLAKLDPDVAVALGPYTRWWAAA